MWGREKRNSREETNKGVRSMKRKMGENGGIKKGREKNAEEKEERINHTKNA